MKKKIVFQNTVMDSQFLPKMAARGSIEKNGADYEQLLSLIFFQIHYIDHSKKLHKITLIFF